MTLRWANERGLSHLIPQFATDEQYFTDYLSTSYPEQHYRPDRYVVRARPSAEALAVALELLRRDWPRIAGADLAAFCEPTSFTGAKRRRLLVTVHTQHTPPWGTWHSLSTGAARQTFTAFRRRINEAICPVCVDHVDFDVRTNAA
jgi:hypothetical protein